MKPCLTTFMLILPLGLLSQSITGKWITVDDETGREKSVVEIFERNGKYFGKVISLFPGPDVEPDPVCDECPEDQPRHNNKKIGMEIIKNLERSGDEYSGGTILDPANGRIYRCRLWVERDELNVRGYWGPFFRTQTWQRAR